MDQVTDVWAEHDGKTTNVHFYGKRFNGEVIHLGYLNMKFQSSPYSSIQATMKSGKVFDGWNKKETAASP